MKRAKLIDEFIVKPGHKLKLKDRDASWHENGDIADELLQKNLDALSKAQEKLYADDRHAVLVILQAMDAAGKDGIVKHVMSGLNPQGCSVYSFKAPSQEELDHTFLWRCMKAAPERGRIAIFNRSHYEEVLIVRVHPEILAAQKLPPECFTKHIWKQRYDDINHFEQHLARNGTLVLKFFLHISKDEQKQRFLERLETPDKNWKFSTGDLKERALWDDYMSAYEDAITATTTKWAPWYVIPANHKPVARAAVSQILTRHILDLNLRFPTPGKAQRADLVEAQKQLLAES